MHWSGGPIPDPLTVAWLETGTLSPGADAGSALANWARALFDLGGADWRENYPGWVTPSVTLEPWHDGDASHLITSAEWQGLGISDCGPGSLSWRVDLLLAATSAAETPGARRSAGMMRFPFVGTDVRENGVSARLLPSGYPGLAQSITQMWEAAHTYVAPGGSVWTWVVPTRTRPSPGVVTWVARPVVGATLNRRCSAVPRRNRYEYGQH